MIRFDIARARDPDLDGPDLLAAVTNWSFDARAIIRSNRKYLTDLAVPAARHPNVADVRRRTTVNIKHPLCLPYLGRRAKREFLSCSIMRWLLPLVSSQNANFSFFLSLSLPRRISWGQKNPFDRWLRKRYASPKKERKIFVIFVCH